MGLVRNASLPWRKSSTCLPEWSLVASPSGFWLCSLPASTGVSVELETLLVLASRLAHYGICHGIPLSVWFELTSAVWCPLENRS